MVKSRGWIAQSLLLFSWCWMVPTDNWEHQHRSLGYDSQENSWGSIVTFLLYVAVNEYSKYLDTHPGGKYACPNYCEVDHKHIKTETEKDKTIYIIKEPLIEDIIDATINTTSRD